MKKLWDLKKSLQQPGARRTRAWHHHGFWRIMTIFHDKMKSYRFHQLGIYVSLIVLSHLRFFFPPLGWMNHWLQFCVRRVFARSNCSDCHGVENFVSDLNSGARRAECWDLRLASVWWWRAEETLQALARAGVRLLERMSAECWLNVMTEGDRGRKPSLLSHITRPPDKDGYTPNFPADYRKS